MDKYVKAEMEIIEFEAEDVITTSNCDTVSIGIGCVSDASCNSNNPPSSDDNGFIWGD